MKLNEITPSGLKKAAATNKPTHPDIIANNIEKYLLSKGFEEVDAGGFSIVYSNDISNIVVKIINYEDPGYNMFVEYTFKNKSKHLPRIAKPIPYETEKGTNYIYVMEKLKFLNTLFDAADEKEFRNTVRHFRAFLNKNFAGELMKNDNTWKKVFRKHKTLFYELQKIKRHFKGKVDIDTHGDNFMVRPETDTIVIIDPVSFLYKDLK